jgi:hypothetical protein
VARAAAAIAWRQINIWVADDNAGECRRIPLELRPRRLVAFGDNEHQLDNRLAAASRIPRPIASRSGSERVHLDNRENYLSTCPLLAGPRPTQWRPHDGDTAPETQSF